MEQHWESPGGGKIEVTDYGIYVDGQYLSEVTGEIV